MSQGNPAYPRSQFLGNPNRRQGGTGKTIAIILGILGLVAVLCCGGFGLMGYLGYSKIGLALVEPLKSYPEVVANIGDFKSATMNIMETAKVQQEEGNQDLLVVDVVGSKGSGKFILIIDKAKANEMKMARLRLPDGRDIELVNTTPDFEAPKSIEVPSVNN